MVSIFSRIFGKKTSKIPVSDDIERSLEKSDKVPSVSTSVENLNTQQDFLTRRISLLERQIEEKKIVLKSAVERGDKTKAKFILSDIKKKESETTRLTSQLINLESIEKALNEARLQKEIASAIESATKTLKSEKVRVEDIEKVMDDAQDLIDSQQETSDILSRRLVNGSTFQEDEEIEAELNSLFESKESHSIRIPLHSTNRLLPESQQSSASSTTTTSREKENLLALLEV